MFIFYRAVNVQALIADSTSEKLQLQSDFMAELKKTMSKLSETELELQIERQTRERLDTELNMVKSTMVEAMTGLVRTVRPCVSAGLLFR